MTFMTSLALIVLSIEYLASFLANRPSSFPLEKRASLSHLLSGVEDAPVLVTRLLCDENTFPMISRSPPVLSLRSPFGAKLSFRRLTPAVRNPN